MSVSVNLTYFALIANIDDNVSDALSLYVSYVHTYVVNCSIAAEVKLTDHR